MRETIKPLPDKPTLTARTIRQIESVLAKEDRVELIPTKDGVRVIHIQRHEVKKE